MKQVIFKPQPSNTVLFSNLNTNKKYYLALTKIKNDESKLYILLNENNGYIFRVAASLTDCGHSGYHVTVIDAIARAQTVGETVIFEFEDIREMIKYIVDFENQ